MSAWEQELTVELRTNVDYEIVIPDTVSDWVSCLPESRAVRTDRLQLLIGENEQPEERRAVVIVKDKNSELADTLHIRQQVKEEESDQGFSATSYLLAYQANSTATISFSVLTSWKTTVSYEGEESGWLSLSVTNGAKGKQYITISSTSKNEAITPRKAYIDITYGSKTQRLTVTQRINGEIDITNKFDPEFARILQEKEYIQDATHITVGEVDEISSLYLNDSQLTSLQGIEYFTALTELECNNNQLTTLDVSKNTKLRSLQCYLNQLTTLDISQNTALLQLECYINQLTMLDVSKNTALMYLTCHCNQLTTLDVSKNTTLKDLLCGTNNLTTLDISKNTALTRLSCDDTPGDGSIFPLIAWFDADNIPSNIELKSSWWSNKLQKNITLQIIKAGSEESFYLSLGKRELAMSADGGETTVPVNTNVEYDVVIPNEAKGWVMCINAGSEEMKLYVAANSTTDAREAKIALKARGKELSDTLHIQQTAKSISQGSFPITEYTIDHLGRSTYVEFIVPTTWQASINYEGTNGWLYMSPTSGAAGETRLSISGTKNEAIIPRKAYIDISYGGNTQRLIITQEANGEIDITDKFDPEFAQVLQKKGYIQNATHITIGEVNKITELYVYIAQLTSLRGIEYFTKLTELQCNSNSLKTLDLSKNTELTHLSCEVNQLTTLDVSKNTKLTTLDCNNNHHATMAGGKTATLTP
ncbi:MAG: hypothetical protein K2M86_00460, partial [Odoribacter sp.]|nr:hypothetical protein [Odoribacter sp.]